MAPHGHLLLIRASTIQRLREGLLISNCTLVCWDKNLKTTLQELLNDFPFSNFLRQAGWQKLATLQRVKVRTLEVDHFR